MKKGEKLIWKYSKLPWWKNWKRSHYANKLMKLDAALSRFFQVNAQALSLRNGMETLKAVNYLCSQMSLVGMNGGMLCAVPRPPDFTVGLDVSLKELKMQLQRVEVSLLVLTAPGGCGKTTLVKMLCQDEEIKGKYVDNIFFVHFTKTPNLKVIVRNLLHHNGCQVPEFQSDEEAITQLEHLLIEIRQKNPILLILDDVWSGSESLLEKFKFHIPDYKILVTSRTAFPRFNCRYNLKPLKEEDAMILFRHSAILSDGSSDIPDEDIVKQVVKFCGGFPLALQVIGRSLCGEPAVTWRKRVKDWSSGHLILDYDSELLNRLKSSVEFSDKKVKSEYETSSYNMILLRELAIHESSQEEIEQREKVIIDISGNNRPKWWTELKQQPISARLLSISTDEMFSSSWCNIQAPELEVLVLNFQTKDYTLPHFVQCMEKLKVLIVTNYGFFPAELGNFQLLASVPHLKRIRLQKVSIHSLFKTPVKLTTLEKISLFMCNIEKNFTNCSIPISDLLPNLREIHIDYCKDLVELPPGLCDIVGLVKISITNCHKLSALPEGIGKLRNLEVLWLRSCINLLELPESIRYLHKLSVLDISDCLSISKLPKYIGELCNLKELHMDGCLNLRNRLPPSTIKLGALKLVVCDEERANLWEHIKVFHMVDTCLEIKVIKKDNNLNWLFNPA
ncbi:hypothetical protein CJ030_MR0G015468 [Morella rubra]|uniref:NB-ARC domain-containing protein n=1 Tax=Morella rubra TaxID=262757 RepID=A0A6A1UI06_9ROSI|nr:hypothetical protein CJ030_MR0G015468 [Morella rubra]